MTREERVLAESLASQGWNVLTAGWPDMIAFRKVNGKMEAACYEVKAGHDSLRPHQRQMHDVLRDAGLDVSVIRLGRKKHAR